MVFLSQRVCIFLRLFISLVRVLSRKATPNLCAASSRWHSLVPPTRSRSGLSSENPRHHLISSHCFTLNLFSCLLKCIFLSYAFSHFYFFLSYNPLMSFAHFSIGFRVGFLTESAFISSNPTFKGTRSTHGRDEKVGGRMCGEFDRHPEFAAGMGHWDF